MKTTISRYLIKGELGRGGMSTVYHAHDPHFNRDVAIKILPREFLHDPTFRARFEREAKTIASLEHPAIVPVYDFGEDDGQPFLVMRYMNGGSLADRLKEGPLSISEATTIIERIAQAVDEAHEAGIIHRDLKPANILFDQRGNAYLADFGIIKLSETMSSILTQSGGLMGTPAYMSPEQARGNLELDGRSDVYSLGVILYEMLTGHPPYAADTPIGLAMMHIFDPVPIILTQKPDLPVASQTIIDCAMAKDRSKRYDTSHDLALAMTQLLAGKLPPPPINQAISERVTESPRILEAQPPKETVFAWRWLGGVILVVLCLLGATILWQRGQFGVTGASPTETAVATAVIALSPSQVPATPTLAPTPIPTYTVTPNVTATRLVQLWVHVPLYTVPVYSGPSITFPIIAHLSQNERVQVLARNENGTWYYIALSDGQKGWIIVNILQGLQPEVLSEVPAVVTIEVVASATSTPSRTPRPPASRTPTNTPFAPATDTPEPPPQETTVPTIRPTNTRPPTATATNTPRPPTNTPIPPTDTPKPPTNTPIVETPYPGPTATATVEPIKPSDTPEPTSTTQAGDTDTPEPTATVTPEG